MDRFGALELRFPIFADDFRYNLLHFTECLPLEKESVHGMLGNVLVHGTYAFFMMKGSLAETSCIIGNLLESGN